MSAVQTCLCFTIHVQWTFWRMFQLQVVIWNIIFKVMVIFFCHARVNFQLFSLFSIWNHVFDLPTSDSPDKFQNESEEEDQEKKKFFQYFFPTLTLLFHFANKFRFKSRLSISYCFISAFDKSFCWFVKLIFSG